MLRKNVKIQLLSGVPLFQGCSKRDLGEIALVADELDLAEGRTIIREGERGREFFVIVEGTAKVTRRGRKLRELGPGDWAGEIALISAVPRTASVVATSPLRVLVVTDGAFGALLRRMPSIAVKVLATLGERLAHDAV